MMSFGFFLCPVMIYYQHSVYMFVGGAASAGANVIYHLASTRVHCVRSPAWTEWLGGPGIAIPACRKFCAASSV